MILPIMAAEPQLCYVRTSQDISAKCQEGIYNQEISTELLNRGLNPNRYFDVQRSFVGADVEASVVKMRLLNSFLAAVLIISASAFFWKKNSELLLAWLAVIAPVTSYFIASVNTSSWNLIGVTIFAITFFSALRNRKDLMLSVPAGAAALFAVWFTNSSRYEGKYVILLLAAAILYSEFAPKNLKFTKKTALISLAILPLIYLIYNYFADVYGRVNIFDDPRFEVTEGITTTANDLLLQNFFNLPRFIICLLYTSPSPRDRQKSRMPSSA